MKTLHGILNGFRQIWAHKVRSGLTILGITLGVAATVSVVGLIQGMFTRSFAFFIEVGGLGMIWSWQVPPPISQKYLAGRSPGFTLRDGTAIRTHISLATFVSPEIYNRGTAVHRRGKQCATRLVGVGRDYLRVHNHEVVRGRYVTDVELERFAPVAVLGSGPVKVLFGRDEDPLHQMINVGGEKYTVIGLLKHYEVMEGNRNTVDWKNQRILIPVTTMQKRLTGTPALSEVATKVTDVPALAAASIQVSNMLLHTHRDIRDFRVESNERWAEATQRVIRPYRFTMGGAVAISLLVAGIGVMNVMLAALHQRVREIGLRKAIGASNWDIFVQFLGESVILAVLGGGLGIVVGAIAIDALQSASFVAGTGLPVFSLDAVLISSGFSVLIGILAGLYPALRAARLNPITALRYE